jgi:YHS domain-containing protein
MTWLLRLLAALVAIVFLRWLWGWFWRVGLKRLVERAVRHMEPPPASQYAGLRRGVMKRDPVCGTFVDTEVSVKETVEGETLHFCSERCRDAFRAEPARRVQAGG